MGNKCKENLIFHVDVLVQHYFSFWLRIPELQGIVRTMKFFKDLPKFFVLSNFLGFSL